MIREVTLYTIQQHRVLAMDFVEVARFDQQHLCRVDDNSFLDVHVVRDQVPIHRVRETGKPDTYLAIDFPLDRLLRIPFVGKITALSIALDNVRAEQRRVASLPWWHRAWLAIRSKEARP